MRILIQECLEASVTVQGEKISSIGKGEVIFVGFTQGDDERLVDRMLEKLYNLRIFSDENGKTNWNLMQNGGTVLCVSQFTLYGDVTHGNRPSFIKALPGNQSEPLYDYTCRKLQERIPGCQFGRFGADMKVHLINDGPFTLLLDSKELFGI